MDLTLPFIEPDKENEGPVGKINGQDAQSREEWRVALALYKLQLEFGYQVPVNGGRRFRGGFVLDFLVYTIPLPAPVNVNGEYWHKGLMSPDERFQSDQLNDLCQQEFNSGPLIELWGQDLQTIDMAFETVRKALLGIA